MNTLGDARLRRLDAPLGEHVLELHTDIPSSDVNNSFRGVGLAGGACRVKGVKMAR